MFAALQDRSLRSKLRSTLTTTFVLLLTVALTALPLVGCAEEQGPMEEMGEDLDEAVDDVQDAVEDAGDEIQDAADDVGDEIEEGVEGDGSE